MTYSEEDKLPNLVTGLFEFGHVTEIKIRRGPVFPAGPIYLKYGVHLGQHRGFGFQHIWKQHCPGEVVQSIAMQKVCALVQAALPPGAPVFYEIGRKLEVYRIQTGRVILELFNSDTPHYSVVSAGYRPNSAAGSRVGMLRRSPP